jgi:UDP-glucose 4-epimerase
LLLGLPAVPAMLGFDPRWQFIHDHDLIGVLAHAARNPIPGTYNAAADGVLTLSEVVSLLGKPLLPILPPWGTGFTAAQLRRLGLPIPLELIGQLRFGRGLDNRRLKATGYCYRYTTREAVLKLRAQQRLRPLLGAGEDPYRYQRDVEEFLRRSPSVRSAGNGEGGPGQRQAAPSAATAEAPPASGAGWYEELSASEVIEISASLDLESLTRLRRYEAAH